MTFDQLFTSLPLIIAFFLTLPLRLIFGMDFDFGLR